MDTLNDSSPTPPKIKLSGYRWVIILFWCFSLQTSTVIMTGFASFATELISAYDITSYHTTYTILVFSIVSLPLNFPANYLFDKFGILPPTIIASLCFIIGSWLRMIGDGFLWIMIG